MISFNFYFPKKISLSNSLCFCTNRTTPFSKYAEIWTFSIGQWIIQRRASLIFRWVDVSCQRTPSDCQSARIQSMFVFVCRLCCPLLEWHPKQILALLGSDHVHDLAMILLELLNRLFIWVLSISYSCPLFLAASKVAGCELVCNLNTLKCISYLILEENCNSLVHNLFFGSKK